MVLRRGLGELLGADVEGKNRPLVECLASSLWQRFVSVAQWTERTIRHLRPQHLLTMDISRSKSPQLIASCLQIDSHYRPDIADEFLHGDCGQ